MLSPSPILLPVGALLATQNGAIAQVSMDFMHIPGLVPEAISMFTRILRDDHADFGTVTIIKMEGMADFLMILQHPTNNREVVYNLLNTVGEKLGFYVMLQEVTLESLLTAEMIRSLGGRIHPPHSPN